MKDENMPVLKPGNESTEYKGKVAMQVLLAIMVVVNSVLKSLDMNEVAIDAETAAVLAVAAEGLWMIWRQGNKSLVVTAQTKVRLAQIERKQPVVNVIPNSGDILAFLANNRDVVDKSVADVLSRNQ